MVCFLPFSFLVTRSTLYHIVIQNAFTLSLSLYIYTYRVSKATTFRRRASFFERKEERAAAKQRDQLYSSVIIISPFWTRDDDAR